MHKLWKKDVTKAEAADTGMALVLLLLLVWYFTRNEAFVFGAAGLHVVNMTAPQLFRPAAVVWFGLTNLLGAVVSRLLLALVFFLVVTPIGLLRRLLGKDTMQLGTFKSGRASVMHVRNHTFTGRDLEQPY